MLGISLGPKLESTDDFQKGHLYWHRMDDEDNTKFVLCTQSDPAPDSGTQNDYPVIGCGLRPAFNAAIDGDKPVNAESKEQQ